MKKILVGKTPDGGKLYFVSGGTTSGIFQSRDKITGVNFWDFVDKRTDLVELRVTALQKKLWSRNIEDSSWVAQFMPPEWKNPDGVNPYNIKVSQALDTIRGASGSLFNQLEDWNDDGSI